MDVQSPYYHRISTINNGVDVGKIYNAQPDADLLRMKGRRHAIVMVAGFREAKDQDTLVRTMALLDKQRYELWLVGVGTRQQEVAALARQLEVSENVRFLGLRMDVPNVLRAADIIVMSSHWEGLSLSNIEGMAAGKPFIASDVNGLREVTKGYGLLFPEGDAGALANEIQQLTDDQAYYQSVADRCYQRAREYDIKETAEKYYKTYTKLMSRHLNS
jgi:glycosyltransferase involved in cell wall biosynthesis